MTGRDKIAEVTNPCGKAEIELGYQPMNILRYCFKDAGLGSSQGTRRENIAAENPL